VSPRRYRLVHRTEYTYDDEVTSSFGLAHLLPRVTDHQHPLIATLEVDPTPSELREHSDFFGNRAAYVQVDSPHRRLVITASSEVEVAPRPALELAALTQPWEAVRDTIALGDDPAAVEARSFVLHSPLVPAWPEVADFAAPLFAPGRPIGAALGDLVSRIHQEFEYSPGATTVSTTLPEVLAAGRGVCQDFAHLAVGALRSVGLAARYVSGYLETTAPSGRPRLVGADASHAWVATYLPDRGWVELDPTNGVLVDERYVVAAHGRDYADVTPIKGVIFTDSKESTLRVQVDLTLLP
jgi:transglutaminase-like putative cysteine protease